MLKNGKELTVLAIENKLFLTYNKPYSDIDNFSK
jgi:hypothetical protein